MQLIALLLFDRAAAVSVALDTIIVLSVLVMNSAVVLKSPSMSGPDFWLSLS